MSVDLPIWAAAAGAAGSLVSAAIAIWMTLERRSTVSKQIEAALGRARDAGPHEATFDVFLSYAAADSKGFARELAEALRTHDIRVWLDQEQIRVGDDAIAKIGEGLNSSRYSLVILSPRFFAGEWPDLELKALVRRETEGRSPILPIWHGVSEDDVRRYAPSLAMKQALRSDSESVEEIASDVAEIAGPKRT